MGSRNTTHPILCPRCMVQGLVHSKKPPLLRGIWGATILCGYPACDGAAAGEPILGQSSLCTCPQGSHLGSLAGAESPTQSCQLYPCQVHFHSHRGAQAQQGNFLVNIGAHWLDGPLASALREKPLLYAQWVSELSWEGRSVVVHIHGKSP